MLPARAGGHRRRACRKDRLKGGVRSRYMISFDEGAMTFPAEDLPDVARSANASSRRGRGRRSMGVRRRVDGFQVGTDATVSESPSKGNRTFLGGFAVVDAPSREQALEWAAKIAVACAANLGYRPEATSAYGASRSSAATSRAGVSAATAWAVTTPLNRPTGPTSCRCRQARWARCSNRPTTGPRRGGSHGCASRAQV